MVFHKVLYSRFARDVTALPVFRIRHVGVQLHALVTYATAVASAVNLRFSPCFRDGFAGKTFG